MKLLMLIMSLFILQGCCKEKECKPKYIYVHDTKYIIPPRSLMKYHKPPKPMPKSTYMEMSTEDRERGLAIYSIHLLNIIGEYRVQTKSIRNWRYKHIKLKEENENNITK